MSPMAKLGEVMLCPVEVAMADQRLAEIDALVTTHSGLPLLDSEGRCIGVVSKKDKARASNGVSQFHSLLSHAICHYLQLLFTPLGACLPLSEESNLDDT